MAHPRWILMVAEAFAVVEQGQGQDRRPTKSSTRKPGPAFPGASDIHIDRGPQPDQETVRVHPLFILAICEPCGEKPGASPRTNTYRMIRERACVPKTRLRRPGGSGGGASKSRGSPRRETNTLECCGSVRGRVMVASRRVQVPRCLADVSGGFACSVDGAREAEG